MILKFLKRYASIFIVLLLVAIQAHIAFLILLYNQRILTNSPLYCNASFAQEFTQKNQQSLHVTLKQKFGEGEADITAEFQDDSPAGKFNSSFHAGGKHKELIKRLKSSLDLKPQGKGKRKGRGRGKYKGKKGGGYPRVFEDLLPGRDVKKSYVYRKRQYQDIVVKEVLPTLYTIDKPFESILKQSPADLKKHNKRNNVIEDFRTWVDGIDPKEVNKVDIIYDLKSKGRSPLYFPDSQRQRYFDETLKEGKEVQLKKFINKYFHHDPNKGDLPMAVRDLYYENLQRLAYMFSSDPTFFMIDYFQENLNKEDFLKNSLAKVSELKNSKTATELLFAIENIYEIQQRATKLLFDFMKKYQHMPPDRKNRLRNETIRRVMNRYKPLLSKKKILNERQSFKIYAKRRLEIMDYLIKQTPGSYRIKDAYFEKGRIYWDMGRRTFDASKYEKAIQIWSKIPTLNSDKGDFINQEAFEKILPLLRAAALRRPEQKNNLSFFPMVNHISQILNVRLQKQLSEKRVREDRLLWP